METRTGPCKIETDDRRKGRFDMTENIKWLEVVMEYGKRFPDVTCDDLLGSSCDCKNKLIDMIYVFGDDPSEYYYIQDTTRFINVFCTVKYGGFGQLEYYSYKHNEWRLVPDNVLLRLLTEGKEDLI